jgi:hypothetical protein
MQTQSSHGFNQLVPGEAGSASHRGDKKQHTRCWFTSVNKVRHQVTMMLRNERFWVKKGRLKLLLTPVSRDAGTDLKVVPVALIFLLAMRPRVPRDTQ